jgi:hypothetical protein
MGYGRYLLAMLLATAAVTGAVVVLHEAGHLLAGRASGCTGEVALDKSLETYTKLRCPALQGFSLEAIKLGGFFLVVPFAFLLFFAGRKYSLIALGFNMLISLSDISFISQAPFLFAAAGLVLVLAGENMLVNSALNAEEIK